MKASTAARESPWSEIRSFSTLRPVAAKTNGLIYFSHAGDLYRVSADGSGQTRVLHRNGKFISHVSFFPRGRVLFGAGETMMDEATVGLLGADGQSVTYLHPVPGDEGDLTGLSANPDGSMLVGCLGTYVNTGGLRIFDGNGGKAKRIPNSVFGDENPHWSPDGAWVLFTTEHRELCKMRPDGTDRTVLEHPAFHCCWHPGGTRVAYTFSVNNTDHDGIYLASADGGEGKLITPATIDVTELTFSPDGNKLAFVASEDGTDGDDLFIIDADGQNLKRITKLGEVFSVVWCPEEIANR